MNALTSGARLLSAIIDRKEVSIMYQLQYKSRFSLPIAESDFVCAMAAEAGMSPDQALAMLVRWFAHDESELAKTIWQRAKADGRGPWK